MFYWDANNEAERKKDQKKRKLTHKKFKEYEDEMCAALGIHQETWNTYKRDIISIFGSYNPKVKYAGRGDSRKWTLTGWLVPEPFDNFIFYCHDGFYKLIETMPNIYGDFKPSADNIMELMMEIANDKKNGKNKETFLPEIFKFFVKWLG